MDASAKTRQLARNNWQPAERALSNVNSPCERRCCIETRRLRLIAQFGERIIAEMSLELAPVRSGVNSYIKLCNMLYTVFGRRLCHVAALLR